MSINFVRTLPSPEEIKEEFPLSKEAVELKKEIIIPNEYKTEYETLKDYIEKNYNVEVTPDAIRIRKKGLTALDRRNLYRQKMNAQ